MTGRPEEGARLVPHGVVRVCGIPVSVLGELSSGKVSELADELNRVEQTWRMRAPAVADALTDVVPTLADRRQRSEVLSLRRILHKAGELTEAGLRPITGLPEAAQIPGLTELVALAAARAELAERLVTGYDQAWTTEQGVLAKVAARSELRTTAQLTSAGMLHNLDRFAADVTGGDSRGKRARTTEATLVNLVSRSALKPSPFGQLVHTRPLLIDDEPAARTLRADERQSVCRLPRQLVSWVERSLAGHPTLAGTVVLRRAPYAAASAKGVVFIVRGRDGTHTAAAVERVVRVQPSPVLDAVLALPADEPILEQELRRQCAELPGADGELDGLINQGVLARDLNIGEQEPDPLSRIAECLRDADEGLRACVRRLAEVEARFGVEDTDGRSELLESARAAVAELAGLCEVPLPPLDAARTLIYEDSVVTTAQREPRDRWERHLPALATMHRLIPLFDDDAHVRAIAGQVVLEAFGPGPHRLLTLYSAMSTPKLRGLLTARLVDVTAPVPTELRRIQDEILQQPETGPSRVEAALDGARLAEIAERKPQWMSHWPRVHWQVQRYSAERGERLVVNGGATGYGRAISRFCTAYAIASRPATGFTEAVRADIAADDDPAAPLTDLSAVLGINANVHPPLLGTHLRYPCGTPNDWGGAGISLEDCWAEVDPATGRLLLRNGKQGPPLRLVTLNFLLNDLAPQLYRFLNFFGIGSLGNLAWWDRVDQRAGRGTEVRAYPRLCLDNVVLARRTWKIPRAELPDLTHVDNAAAFRTVRAWRRSLGLPEQVFWRSFTIPDPLVAVSEEERERLTRTLVSFPSAAERKPAFLDFTSVTSVRTWQRAMRRAGDELTVQECLPAPGEESADVAVPDGGAAGELDPPPTREFTIETSGPAR
ncbi:lantibiotic dehydratase [Streptomyces sp. RPT161]|uniref:lantibiotic dehydratase n=1 Tax=Streptomyces sp. RPT161 TaxID=3015993 RepID=UPI0022B885CF|nr:lantibiotic dehydratase [Streptomyces sp. RPT161]